MFIAYVEKLNFVSLAKANNFLNDLFPSTLYTYFLKQTLMESIIVIIIFLLRLEGIYARSFSTTQYFFSNQLIYVALLNS